MPSNKRITKLQVQHIRNLIEERIFHVTYTSPGSAMTSMQMYRAITDGILIPWRKSEPEKPKTALQ